MKRVSSLITSLFFFFFLINLFIYLLLAVLGLRCCARAFSSCGKRGPLFIAVRGPLTDAASPIAEHRLQTRRLSSCGSRAQPLCGMWDLPRPGLKPMCPALAGRFSTTAPPGKPSYYFSWHLSSSSIYLLHFFPLICFCNLYLACKHRPCANNTLTYIFLIILIPEHNIIVLGKNAFFPYLKLQIWIRVTGEGRK